MNAILSFRDFIEALLSSVAKLNKRCDSVSQNPGSLHPLECCVSDAYCANTKDAKNLL